LFLLHSLLIKSVSICLYLSDTQFALESEAIEKDWERQFGKIDMDKISVSDSSDGGKRTIKVRNSPPAIQGLNLHSPKSPKSPKPAPTSPKSDFTKNPPRKPKFTKKKPPPPPKKAPKAALPTTYRRVSKDLAGITKDSLKTSFHTRRYSEILRNQLIRAHTHSLLEFALKFEGYRKKNPYNNVS
jgi:hypothetical protein